MFGVRLASICLTLFPCCLAAAQGPELAAVRLKAPPKIDGAVDPAEWEGASRAGAFVNPQTGSSPADLTEAWIAYDEQAIYVAFIGHDSNPGGIVGREITPGAEFEGEDTFTLRINPFGNQAWESVSEFSVNAIGTASEDISGGRAAKQEWRGFWQAAARRLGTGWSAEMRIPWKVLNYPAGNALTMDVVFERYQARTKLDSTFPNLTASGRSELMARWKGVQTPPADPRKWDFLAYAAAESDRGRFGFRSGLDTRYAISPTMTGLVSVNPDFRNIESEIAGIDFSRTERFLDESRPFFTEGGDYFRLTPGFTFGQMFYSRRIGGFDVGAKAFGKLSPTLSVGALTTLDNGESSASVARIAKSFGSRSSISAYGTNLSEPGLHNSAAGVNGSWGAGNYFASLQSALETKNGRRANSALALNAGYEIPNTFVVFQQSWVQPDFDPALAFVPWRDRVGWYLFGEHGKEVPRGWLREYGVDLYVEDYRTYADQLQARGYETSASIETRSNYALSLSRYSFEFEDGLDQGTGIELGINPDNRYKQFAIEYDTGTRAGSRTALLEARGSLRLFGRLDAGISFARQEYRGTESQTVFTLGYQMSPTQAFTGRLVNTNGKANAYLAYRNGGAGGTEYYVILGDPSSTTGTTRARLSVKVVWAF